MHACGSSPVQAVKEAGASADESLTEELSEAWRLLGLAHEEHAKHEDVAIFKTYPDFLPGVAKKEGGNCGGSAG